MMDAALRAEIAAAIPEGGVAKASTDDNPWSPLMGMMPLLMLGALPIYWYAMMKKGRLMDLSQKTVHRIFTLLVDELTERDQECKQLRLDAIDVKNARESVKMLTETNQVLLEEKRVLEEQSSERLAKIELLVTVNAGYVQENFTLTERAKYLQGRVDALEADLRAKGKPRRTRKRA